MDRGVGDVDYLQRLWTPHRMSYIVDAPMKGGEGKAAGSKQPFIDIPTMSDEEGLIVARGEQVYAVLNLYPYNAGHTMVVPYRQVANLEDLTPAERDHAKAVGQAILEWLKPAMFSDKEKAREAIAENLMLEPIMGKRLNVMDEAHLRRVIDYSAGARLIVLDTLSRIHSLDENSNGDMARLVATLEHVAASTGAPFSVHTSGSCRPVASAKPATSPDGSWGAVSLTALTTPDVPSDTMQSPGPAPTPSAAAALSPAPGPSSAPPAVVPIGAPGSATTGTCG